MTPPRRIVSLVPSLTEALFAFGLGERVVGVTDWCVHPAGDVADLPKVGGTKNPDLARVDELRPDLVIANHEENTRRDVERMRAAGLEVWVTYPRTLAEAVETLRAFAGLGADPSPLEAAVAPVEAWLARSPPGNPVPYFCPIWKSPWMSIGADTYANDLLRHCGGRNVFEDREERRYPIVDDAAIVTAAPEVVLLPDEPYAFAARDVAELGALDLPAARAGRIHCVDGTWVTWYGPRMAEALRGLSGLLGVEVPV